MATTAVAHWLWFRGIGRLTATQAGFLRPLSPRTAAAVGWTAPGPAPTSVQPAGVTTAFGATPTGRLVEGRGGRPLRHRSSGPAGESAEAAAEPALHPAP